MTEIIRLQDPVLETIEYLKPWISARSEVPARWAWDDLLVTVQDAGGTGERDLVLDDVLLSLMVAHPDRETASTAARDIHGLLRAWTYASDRVSFDATIQRPTYDPDPDTRTPAYTFTVRIIFRAETATVEPKQLHL